MEKSPEAFRTISEVGTDLDVPQHVLRFWETKFSQIKPMKRAGGRRYYRPTDVDLLRGIRHLLYGEGFTIRGVQKLLREHGPAFAIEAGRTGGLPTAATPDAVAEEPETAMDEEDVGNTSTDMPTSTSAAINSDERAALEQILKELEHARELVAGSKSLKPF
jgi:DNA-binding transcriptional MerR regulator